VALDALGGKWKLAIIKMLAAVPRRTGELRRAISVVSQRTLIAQLRELQREGLIARTSYNEVPPRVVYRLTRYSRTAVPILRVLSKWGTRHAEQSFTKQGIEYRVEEIGCR
jgi:DNA-binding HxlR family transcriptional regulator